MHLNRLPRWLWCAVKFVHNNVPKDISMVINLPLKDQMPTVNPGGPWFSLILEWISNLCLSAKIWDCWLEWELYALKPDMREAGLSFCCESLGIRCIFSPSEKSNLLHELETLGRASVPEWKALTHPQVLHKFLVSICSSPCRRDVWWIYHNHSQWRALLPSRGPLVMSADIRDYHSWRRAFAGIKWVDTRDAATHPIMQMTYRTTKNYQIQKCQRYCCWEPPRMS